MSEAIMPRCDRPYAHAASAGNDERREVFCPVGWRRIRAVHCIVNVSRWRCAGQGDSVGQSRLGRAPARLCDLVGQRSEILRTFKPHLNGHRCDHVVCRNDCGSIRKKHAQIALAAKHMQDIDNPAGRAQGGPCLCRSARC